MKKILAAVAASIVALGAHAQQPHRPWSYEGASGTTHWAELDTAYKQCKFGKHQSPINIDTGKAVKAALESTAFAYKSANAEMVNTGHSVQVNLPPGSAATIDGVGLCAGPVPFLHAERRADRRQTLPHGGAPGAQGRAG